MSEQKSNKAGLHREISSIFKGVPIPQKDDGQKPSGYAQSPRTDDSEPKPPATEPQKPDAQDACQVTPSSPNASKPEQPEADVDDTEKNISSAKGIPLWKTQHAEQPCGKAVPQGAGYAKPKPKKPDAPKASPAAQSLPKSTSTQQPKGRIDETKKDISKSGAVVKIREDSILERIKNKLSPPTSRAGAGDSRQKTMVLVIPVLFVILLFLAYRGGVFGKRARPVQANGADTLSSVDTTDSGDGIDWEIPAPLPSTLRNPMLRDPVENTQTETETEIRTLPTLVVKGIMYSEDSRSAVIGNQIVHEGERIRGATVVRISKDNVEFEMNGKKWTQAVQ